MTILASIRRLRHGPLRCFSPLWVIAGRIYRVVMPRLGLMREVRQSIGPYGPFRMNGEFAFSDFEHWGGGHNEGFIACVEACAGKRCVLDVGAHIGLVCMPMATKVHPDGEVHAFEPAAVNRRHLLDHVSRNGLDDRITVHGCLVGGQDLDRVDFNEMDKVTGQNSLVVKKAHKEYRRTSLPQVTLDSFCRTHGLAPEVIKVDVEGAEIGVLEGAREVLLRDRPVIYLSVHPTEIGLMGRTLKELDELIDELGYRVTTIGGDPVDEYRLSEYLMTPVTRSE